MSRVLINAVESYVRNIARETRDIQAAITINEQLLVEVGSQVKQSSELTIRLHQEQSHNVAAVRDAVENLTSGIEAQKQCPLISVYYYVSSANTMPQIHIGQMSWSGFRA